MDQNSDVTDGDNAEIRLPCHQIHNIHHFKLFTSVFQLVNTTVQTPISW
jgi:hypothetical protein